MDLIRFSLLRLRPSLTMLQRIKHPTIGIVQRNNHSLLPAVSIHTTAAVNGVAMKLWDFFDVSDNYDREAVQVGRPWRKDELRIKSNQDLHKLWYVFLKERNMLLTMEEYYKQECELFPSPERLEKIEESMENLLEVIKERDTAFNLLEKGTSGERKKRVVRNMVGIPIERTQTEHYQPQHVNRHYKRMHPNYTKWMKKYLSLYEEKMRRRENYAYSLYQENKKNLMAKYPHLTDEDCDHLKPNSEALEKFLKNTGELGDHDSRHEN